MTRRWLAAGGGLLLLAVATTLGTAHGAVAATGATSAPPPSSPPSTEPLATGVGPNPSGASLRLVSQTAWVTPGTPFNMALQVHVAEPADQVLVYVDVYTALGSRSEFARSLTPDWAGFFLSRPVRGVPLSTFKPDAGGNVDVSLPTGSLANELHVGLPGVYPVAVTLRTRGIETPIARFMTDLIATPTKVTRKLDVAWVVPIHAPPPDPGVAGSVLPADQAPWANRISIASHAQAHVVERTTSPGYIRAVALPSHVRGTRCRTFRRRVAQDLAVHVLPRCA